MSRQRPWTEQENALIRRQHERGVRWRDMESPAGRTRAACEQQLSKLLRWERAAGAASVKRQRVRIATQPVPAAPAPPSLGRSSAYSSTHLLDAELRARIALQGLTAGFLGDPPPGRSALDFKRAGLE